MSGVLVKIIAAALTVSQVSTRPDQVKTQFDPVKDQAEAIQILQNGCSQLTSDLGAQQIDFDAIFTPMLANAKLMGLTLRIKEGLEVESIAAAYKLFCKKESVTIPGVDLKDVLTYANETLKDLPDHSRLKGLKLPQSTFITDHKGERFTEIYRDNSRRRYLSLKQIPPHVVKAFVAAEDKNFYQHKGLDLRGLIRAFMNNMSKTDERPEGGSTITQQVVKNLVVGDDVTFERKIREVVIAARVEKLLSKDEILEIYLNYIFLGRASWGIGMAAESYFGKTVDKLTVGEGAFLAGLTKGPMYFDPNRYPERAIGRTQYVLRRLKEDFGKELPEQDLAQAFDKAEKGDLGLVNFASPASRRAYYFLDDIVLTTKRLLGITEKGRQVSQLQGATIQSTIHRDLQAAAERSLQEGLAQFEIRAGRAKWPGPEFNISAKIAKVEERRAKAALKAKESGITSSAKPVPAWQDVLRGQRPLVYDSHWPLGVVLDKNKKNGVRVGLADGQIVSLNAWSREVLGALKIHDVVHVQLTKKREAKNRSVTYASLRFRPKAQGSVLVLENKTGRVLAQAGGFAYPLSQLNRTRTLRQPGSTVKPLSYLAAFQQGFQPNTLISTDYVTLAPIIEGRGAKTWTPRGLNVGPGFLTLRQALETSHNTATARILELIKLNPADALDMIRNLATATGAYRQPLARYYPVVLGAQETSLIDLATLYATIANHGLRPTPYWIERVTQGDKVTYQAPPRALAPVSGADQVAFLQVKNALSGSLEHGTAKRLKAYVGKVAGKTGTSNAATDAWFVGFTNDITIAVWAGYDNATNDERRTLGSWASGGSVALPIFEQVLVNSFETYKPAESLSLLDGPAAKLVEAHAIDPESGEVVEQGNLTEFFRVDPRSGYAYDTMNFAIEGHRGHALAKFYPEIDGGVRAPLTTPEEPPAQRSATTRNSARPSQAPPGTLDLPVFPPEADGELSRFETQEVGPPSRTLPQRPLENRDAQTPRTTILQPGIEDEAQRLRARPRIVDPVFEIENFH